MLADVLDVGSARWGQKFSKAGDINYSSPSIFQLPAVANVIYLIYVFQFADIHLNKAC